MSRTQNSTNEASNCTNSLRKKSAPSPFASIALARRWRDSVGLSIFEASPI